MYVAQRAALAICLTLFVQWSVAQQFGGNPPSIHWKQLNSDSVRVIFPEELSARARDVFRIASGLPRRTGATIGDRIEKVSIVMQNQTVISNGYVSRGPFRSEFFLTPEQNSFELGSLPWHQMLAMHEYRHVQQFSNFRKGIAKAFYILAGDLGLSFANNLAIPNWFWEGDAVYQETLLSNQGRGRLPYFLNGYRSLWASGKSYSWMKLRNGSLRDYVPNHYPIGYLLTAYGRQTYGDDFWRRVTDDASRFRGIFYPFQRAILKYSGKSYEAFRNDAFKFYKDQMNLVRDTSANYGAQPHFAGNEEYPYWLDNEHVLYVKSSYKRIAAFFIRDVSNGSTLRVATKGMSIDNYFSYRSNSIIYAIYRPDARWGWRDYGDICILDLKDGTTRTITHRAKYFSPDISEDKQRVVAVQVATDGRCELHLLDARNGQVIRAMPNPQQFYYTYPKFYDANHVVTAARNASAEMALLLLDINTGQMDYLVPFTNNVIGFPTVNGDTITFTASHHDRDQLFAIINRELYAFEPSLKNSSVGEYHLSARGNHFAWTTFTAAGFHLLYETNNSALRRIAVEELMTPLPVFGIKELLAKRQTIDTVGAPPYTETSYRKTFQLFRFHSWLPTIDDPDYSVSFLSENILNTLQSEVFLTYNTDEKSKKAGFDITYGAWFPWLRAGSAFTSDRSDYYNGSLVTWNEVEANAGLVVPLNFSDATNFRNLDLSTDFVYTKPVFRYPFKDVFDGRGYAYISSRLFFANRIQRARMHIYPRLAQSLQLHYSRAVTVLQGNQWLASGYWYFPGLSLTHNLVINTAFQGRDTMRNILFTNDFPFSRGYIARNFHHLWKAGINYHFPLCYPDWGFGNIVYFFRLRANIFYDYTHAEDFDSLHQPLSLDYRSYGAEIFFDTNWWNQNAISFGIRYSRLTDAARQGISPNQWEFVLPVNLLNR